MILPIIVFAPPRPRFVPVLRPAAVSGLFLGLALLACASVSAQELLKNPDFEAPFPGASPYTNWTLVYVDGGPSDFAIAGQSTEASRCCGGRGAHLRANNWNFAHAYFSQVVTNLAEGANYTFTIQKMQAGFQNYVDSGKLEVYAVVVSGSNSQTVYGNATSVGPYSVTITADASRQIEIQLHMAKRAMASDAADDYKSSKCTGWFDDASLKLAP